MMTVSPKMTMLPPIWVAACDSQSRRKAPLRKTASAPEEGAAGSPDNPGTPGAVAVELTRLDPATAGRQRR